MEPVLLIGGVIAVIVVIAYLAWLYEKKRTEAMEAYAQQRGWAFEGSASVLEAQLDAFKLFNQGHSRRLNNAMRGAKDQVAVAVADYRYTTGRGKNSHTHNQTICMVRVPGLALPHFFARRQVAFFDAIGKMFGGQDVNFEEDQAFSKAYVLQTQSGEETLRRSFNDRARAAFLGLANRNPQVEGVGEVLLLHFSRRLKVDEVDALVADAVNLVRVWSPR
ncbi:MAG: hypothetical protein IT380_00440 [Myxococcales bacterium]|nr:hypothetical protein [Myxococcales bacterium]